MIETLLVIFLGCIGGIITGLIPGIHINLISTLLLLSSGFLLELFTTHHLVIFIISMGIVHSFIDFIPSIIFGVPNSDTALSMLPAHKLVVEGEGKQALFLSASGSLLGACLSLPLLVVLYYILPIISPIITPYIPFGLIGVSCFFLLQEKTLKKMLWPFLFTLLLTFFGILLLNSYHLRQPLLVLFTGLFGISTLLFSLNESSNPLPKQLPLKKQLPKGTFKSLFSGNLCAALCSALPGLGNAQAATILTLFYKDISSKLFLLVTSALNTTSFLVSIITLSILEKARNGAIVVVSQLIDSITFDFLLQIIFISLILCFIGFGLTLFIGEKAINFLTKINETKLNTFLVIFLVSIIFFAEGIYGIMCLLGITMLGYLGLLLEIRKVHFMNILLIPVSIFLL